MKRLLALLICFSFALSLFSCSSPGLNPYEETLPQTETKGEEPQKKSEEKDPTEDENFPFNSLSNYGIQYFLYGRDRGQTGELKGKVLFLCVLLSDSEGAWDEDATALLKQTHQESARMMQEEASAYGVELEPVFCYVPCRIETAVDREGYDKGIQEAIGKLGYEDREKMIPDFKAEYAADEAVLLFCLNCADRSFCYPATDARDFEYAVLYGANEDFRHETYHLFGARDLYVPSRIESWARSIYPNSIMLTTKEGAWIDSLSAYVIGWTDTFDTKAKTYLKAASKMTSRDWDE